MSSPEFTAETIKEWLNASCAAQGVPVTIRDHAVIAQVATLLGHHYSRGAQVGRRKRMADRASFPRQPRPVAN